MRLLALFTAFWLSTSSLASIADDFSIDDPKLASLPKAINTAIRKSGSVDYHSCKLIGKPINLSGQSAKSGFIVTTDDACNWGAAQGPIWVVRVVGGAADLVLQHVGQSVTLGKNSQNGLRQLAISSGTAARYSYSLWKFDDATYRRMESYMFTPEDKALCRAHSNICPWKL